MTPQRSPARKPSSTQPTTAVTRQQLHAPPPLSAGTADTAGIADTAGTAGTAAVVVRRGAAVVLWFPLLWPLLWTPL